MLAIYSQNSSAASSDGSWRCIELCLGLRFDKKKEVCSQAYSYSGQWLEFRVVQVRMTLRAQTLCIKQGELESHCSRPCPVKFWATSNDGDSTVSLEILLHFITHSDFFITRISHIAICACYLLVFFSPEESSPSLHHQGAEGLLLEPLIWRSPEHTCRVSESLCSGGPHCIHWQHLLCTGEPQTPHASPAVLCKVWNREE